MWTVYTKQFDPGVWGSMVLVVTAAALCLYLVSRRSLQQQNASLSDSAFIVVGFVFGQGERLLPHEKRVDELCRCFGS